MFELDLHAAANYVMTATEIAASRGISLRMGSDFAELQKYKETGRDLPALAPLFAPSQSRTAPDREFWIVGVDDEGELVHTQAMRLIDLSDQNLAQYLRGNYHSFIPAGNTIDPKRSTFEPSPGCRQIKGRVCCHGNLWLKGGARGYRGSGLGAVLPRLALALTLMRWTPDFMFGFVYPAAAFAGLAAREGYMHLEPGNIKWHTPHVEQPLEAWLVWMNQTEISYLMGFCLHELYQKLGNDGANKGKSNKDRQVANKTQPAVEPLPEVRRQILDAQRASSI